MPAEARRRLGSSVKGALTRSPAWNLASSRSSDNERGQLVPIDGEETSRPGARVAGATRMAAVLQAGPVEGAVAK